MPERKEASGTIPAHTGQKARSSFSSDLLGKRFEKHIDRGPAGIPLAIRSEPELPALNQEVQTCRSHEHTPLPECRQCLAIFRVAPPRRGLPIEPLRKRSAEEIANVDNQKNWDWESGWQSPQYFYNRSRTASRSPNGDDAFSCRTSAGLEGYRSGRRLPQ